MEPDRVDNYGLHAEQSAQFEAAWLHERYRFDAAARCRRVQAAAVAHLTGRLRLRVLDLGAGLGANTRYYATALPCDQEWTLLEHDPTLAEQCQTALTVWAEEQGWHARRTAAHSLRIDGGDKCLEIRVVHGTVQHMGRAVSLDGVDVVTANALFDLFSVAQFRALTAQLALRRIPLLTTLNYTAMAFAPPVAEDEYFLRLYEQHMTREQAWGQAMGPQCADCMRTVLASLGYTVRHGTSVWTVAETDQAMLRAMLGFMQAAIPSVVSSAEALHAFHAWLAAKNHLIAQRRLRLRVHHVDLFAWLAQAERQARRPWLSC